MRNLFLLARSVSVWTIYQKFIPAAESLNFNLGILIIRQVLRCILEIYLSCFVYDNTFMRLEIKLNKIYYKMKFFVESISFWQVVLTSFQKLIHAERSINFGFEIYIVCQVPRCIQKIDLNWFVFETILMWSECTLNKYILNQSMHD